MIRDRGNIKWNAMMLTEHVTLLREWKKKDQYIEKPQLDEWALQELSEQLQLAFQQKLEVELKIWNEKQISKVTGIISKLDEKAGIVCLASERHVPFHSICGVTIYD